MDIIHLLLGTGALTTLLSTVVLGIKMFKSTKKKTKDNEKWTDLVGDVINTAKEYDDEIKDLVGQINGVIRAVEKDKKSKERIMEDKEEFEALKKKVAEELGPEAVSRLAEALVPVPDYVHENLGSSDDKVRKLVQAQSEALSDKERANKVLSDSGKMFSEIVKALVSGLPQIKDALNK